MKLTVQEWNQFWKDIGDDWYIDESSFPEDFPQEGPIEGDGIICWQSKSPSIDATNTLFTHQELKDAHVPFSKLFKRWRKKQSCRIFTVQIPQEKTEEFEKLVKSLKGDILS